MTGGPGADRGSGRIRVLLADDHPVVREGLRGMLAAEADIEVIRRGRIGAEAAALAAALRPDVVLMDLRMPGGDGVLATARIRDEVPAAQIMVLTTYDSDNDILRAVEAGAAGYLLKETPRADLVTAIRAAARGETVLAAAVAGRLVTRIRGPQQDALSPRETDVLALGARGMTNAEIGRRLFISEATVKTHLVRACGKLGVSGRTAAVAKAMETGALRPPERLAGDRPGSPARAAGPLTECEEGAVHASVENLAIVWASVDRLCSGLPDWQWDLPTGCPGWTVQDHVSHLVDYEARALGRPAPGRDPGPLPHVRNALGRANEIGVDVRRSQSGAAVLSEFRQVTAERLAQLRQLTEQDLAGPAVTPAGPGTVADMLTLRVMDSWTHEQDIRRAAQVPGHREGPAVDEAVGYFSQFLPYVVGRRAAAPDGSRVVFRTGGQVPVVVEVTGGRGRLAADPQDATVTMIIPVATFAALAAGRGDVPGDVVITGDRQLGERVLASMSLMP